MALDRGTVLHNAQLFAARGQFDAAINEWKRLSAESPGDGSIFNSIGELQLKRKSTAEAVTAFMQAANAFKAEGATLKAVATYKKVLKIEPSRYEVYRHLGDLNAERGLLSSAVQDYLTLGKYYLKERKTKEALDIYKKIVSQDPSNLDAQQRVAELCLQENMQDEATKVYLQLGRERSAQQRYAEAKDAYQAVLRIDPSNSEAQQFIQHFEKTGGKPSASPKASVSGSGGPAKGGEPLDLLSEAARRIEEKQFAGAEAILNQMLTKEPGNPDVCRLLAKLHLDSGDLQVALGEYRFLAGAALRAQEYTQAESLIAEFLTVEPNSVALLELYGELYEEKGEVGKAVEYYAKAFELLLKHPEPGMPTLHEEILEKVVGLAPDNPAVQRMQVLMKGEVSAEPTPMTAAEPAPSTPAPEAPKVEEFTVEGAKPDDAWSMTSKITKTQDRPFSVAEQAKAEPDKKEVEPQPEWELPKPADETVVVFSTANAAPDTESSSVVDAPRAQPPEPPLSTREQVEAFINAGQPVKAELLLSRVVITQPNDAEARALLGSVLESKGDHAGAASQYSQSLELLIEGTNQSTLSELEPLYQKVKELAPASPIVAKLAATFAPPSPVALAAKASEPADPIDPETHYTLGVAYKNMGLLDEAKEEFTLSMRGTDFFLDSCLMLAMCLKEQGQGEVASAQLELLLNDARCQGAKAQAIRYELGLLYEGQEQWAKAVKMYDAIPTFHDVPQRLEAVRAQTGKTQSASASMGAFRYASN